MTRDRCPTCGHDLRPSAPDLTPRELQLLIAWWTTGSVVEAADEIGVSGQRAKNMLARARIRSGVKTNDQLVLQHLESVRLIVREATSHNSKRVEAA